MEKLKAFINDYGGAVVVWLFLLLLIILCSCTTTKYIEVEVPKTHTEYITNHTTDSIFLKDSIYVNQYIKGDTIFKEKEVIKYRGKSSTSKDTVHIIDTIPKLVKYDNPELLKKIEESKAQIAVEKKMKKDLTYALIVSIILLFVTNYKVVWAIIKKVF